MLCRFFGVDIEASATVLDRGRCHIFQFDYEFEREVRMLAPSTSPTWTDGKRQHPAEFDFGQRALLAWSCVSS